MFQFGGKIVSWKLSYSISELCSDFLTASIDLPREQKRSSFELSNPDSLFPTVCFSECALSLSAPTSSLKFSRESCSWKKKLFCQAQALRGICVTDAKHRKFPFWSFDQMDFLCVVIRTRADMLTLELRSATKNETDPTWSETLSKIMSLNLI